MIGPSISREFALSQGLVLREAGLRQVTYIVQKLQLRLYGHVARLSAEDPAHPILVGIRVAEPRREGRPQASRLRQVEAYLRNMGMMGKASAWAMGRRRPK